MINETIRHKFRFWNIMTKGFFVFSCVSIAQISIDIRYTYTGCISKNLLTVKKHKKQVQNL